MITYTLVGVECQGGRQDGLGARVGGRRQIKSTCVPTLSLIYDPLVIGFWPSCI